MSGDRYSKSLVNEKWNGDQRNMNNKNFNMVCPNCKGKMVIDRDNGCLRCLHCDTEIPLDESDDVVIERIRNNAKLRSEINRNETNKTIQKMQGKVEIEKSKHKVTRLFIMAFIIVVLIGAYAGWRIVHRIDNYQEEMSHRDKIQITSTVSDFEGKRFSDMEMYLKDAGYTNIEGIPLNDLTKNLLSKDGMIASISINGTTDFGEGDWFEPETPIKITYHSVSDEELEGIQPLESASYYVGKDFSIAEADMTDSGFTNIELIPAKDLNEGDKNIGNIIEIMINGNNSFDYTTLFAEDATVEIKYHSRKLKSIAVGTSAEEFRKKNFRTVINDLKNAGFYNFDYSLLEDATLFVKKDTVEEVSINGNSSFLSTDKFEEDARINISIHIDKKDRVKIESELYPDSGRVILPLSRKEMIGKDYQQINQQLVDAGFTNIVLCPNPDIEDGFNPKKKKDGEIQSVTINGTSEFKKNLSYDNDVLIRIIYHTYVEKEEVETQILGENEIKLTFSSKDLKGKNHDDVSKQLRDAGFINITEEKIEDIKKDSKFGFFSKEDGEVEKVSIDGNDSFKKEAIFNKNSKVVITYHTYEN